MNGQAAPRDVVVVGGGPAGSATATLLARQGWDVLLLDRARFPRDKACGEFLTPAARPLLEALGVWDPLVRQGIASVPAVRLFAPSGRYAEYHPSSAEPAGYSIRRTVLDAELLAAARSAGVEVREDWSVRAVTRDERNVMRVRARNEHTDKSHVSARLIVGADGAHSIVARSLGTVRSIKCLQRIAVVSHWSGVGDVGPIEMRSANGIVCGLGPLRNGDANVTIVARTSEASRIAGRPGEYLAQTIIDRFPDLAERLKTTCREPIVRTVGCFGHYVTRASGAGMLLVGDAATFVDPFTGEGVYFALSGALRAAETANECLKRGDLSPESLYAYDVRRGELKQRYLLCAAVQAVVRTPALMERVVARCAHEPVTLARLMEVLGDIAPPLQVLRPSFAARLFM